jgi:HAD-superfamily subfamily IIA hydrolase, TIGR01458
VVSAPIHGFLLDLDGVFYVEGELIAGAVEALERLKCRNIPYRFITNTTTQSSSALGKKLVGLGIPCEPDQLMTAPVATAEYLKTRGFQRCYFAVNDSVIEDFAMFEHTETRPDAVVVGDIGDAWNYALVDKLFGYLRDGAELVAMHRNKYWQKARGLHVDIGAFVAGLEYVADVKATVTGKPSKAFFDAALASMGLSPRYVVLVGDDIQSDIGGAQSAGLRGVLVETGKYRPDLASQSAIVPEWQLASVAELDSIL